MFWRQFGATGQLRTVFLTRFSFLTKVTNYKQNDSCEECFDAYFKQLDSCARCFGQFSDFNKSRQFQAERKLRRVFWREFRATGQLRTVFSTSFSLLTTVAKFKKNDSCARCFGANFGQQDSCTQCFGQVLAFYQKTTSSSKWTIAHGVLDNFQILTEVANFKQNESCAECFDANFEQQDSCARTFREVLAS